MKAEVISTCLVLLILFPIVSSSSSSSQEHDGHTSNKHTLHHQLPRKLSFQIRVHGFLLWASMGFLMPLGILIIRMSNREECGRRVKIIFRIHATLQVLSVILATIGAIMSVINFENSFKNSHQRMGLTLYGVIWLQALIGFMRPHRGSSGRSVWFLGHWILGTTVSVLGIINVYTGLHAYHKRTSSSSSSTTTTTTTSGTSSSIRLWTLLFTAEVCLLAFFYLFQDKWPYIQKQGVILGNQPVHVQPTDQMIYPRDHKPNDSC